jgi:DNA replication protein DnaC
VSQRYNEQRPTLLTSNYLDTAPRGEVALEERIGTRTRSRLQEMCRTVHLDGPDHRRAP